MMRILSLGAGVQSTTVLLMSLRGDLPKLDCAIFADTGWEPPAVYRHLEWLEEQARQADMPIHRVQRGNIRADGLEAANHGLKSKGERFASIPYYTRGSKGEMGKIQRQCTREYKIDPIEKKIRELLGLKYRQRWPIEATIELWMGISGDESRRARISDAKWKVHRFPLIFDIPMRRSDCLAWLEKHGYPQAPRSACVGCPFHSDHEWRQIKADPELWADVTEFDAAIRDRGGMRGQLFLHRSCQPLIQVDLSTPEERGQLSLWNEECLGYCGV